MRVGLVRENRPRFLCVKTLEGAGNLERSLLYVAAKDVPGSPAGAGAAMAVERSGLERGEEVAGFRCRGKESQTLEGWA
jgi:hypothetical protein